MCLYLRKSYFDCCIKFIIVYVLYVYEFVGEYKWYFLFFFFVYCSLISVFLVLNIILKGFIKK